MLGVLPVEKFIWAAIGVLRKGLSDTGLLWNTCYDCWCLISSWNRAPVSQKPSIVFHLVLHQRKYCQFQGVKQVLQVQLLKKKIVQLLLLVEMSVFYDKSGRVKNVCSYCIDIGMAIFICSSRRGKRLSCKCSMNGHDGSHFSVKQWSQLESKGQ